MSTQFGSRSKFLSRVSHVTGSLSVVGSLVVIAAIGRRKSGHLEISIYHRLVLGMSIADLLSSCAFCFGTYPIPDGSPVSGARGNQMSCNVQGFFVQLTLATHLYSSFLAIYFLLVVKFNWNTSSLAMRRLEVLFHGLAWSFALGTALASLLLDLINNANLWCWIAPFPLDCINSAEVGDGEQGTCVRGDNAWIYRLAFYFVWVWIAFLVVLGCMAILVRTYRKQFQRMRAYLHSGDSLSIANQRRVTLQAMLFIGSFLLTALPLTVARMLQATYNCTVEYFALSLAIAIFYPLQGFWNALIYFKPYERRLKSTSKPSTTTRNGDDVHPVEQT